MNNIFSKSLLVLILSLLVFIHACTPAEETPVENTEEYQQAVSNFYVSLGASQTDEARFAFNKMNDVAQAFPQEAAAWANLGVYAMRQGNFDLAAERISQAAELQPNNSDILYLAGLIESRRGNTGQSIAYLRRGIEANPEQLRIRYALLEELEREDDVANADEVNRLLSDILNRAPENRLALMEGLRLAVKNENKEQAEEYVNQLENLIIDPDLQQQQQFSTVKSLLDEGDFSGLALEVSFLRVAIEPEPEFQADAEELRLPPTDIGFLLTEFLYLPKPEVAAAEPDLEMNFEVNPLDLPNGGAVWAKGVTLLEDLPPFPISVFDGNIWIDESTQLPFPGSTENLLPVQSVIEIDYNYDFRNDLAAAGEDGFRLFRLNDDQTFTDVTAQLGLNNSTLNGNYDGLWTFDVEMDGDLDILLSSLNDSPVLLRNNGDNSFLEQSIFEEFDSLREVSWADMDGNGAPEAIVLGKNGELSVYSNLRGGSFDTPVNIASNIVHVAIADLNADGAFDIVALRDSGEYVSFTYQLDSSTWVNNTLFTTEIDINTATPLQLFTTDIDNNGSIDILLSGQESAELLLGNENHEYEKHPLSLETGKIINIFDVEGDERLDFLVVSSNEDAFYLKNIGTKNYFARSIRARASGGDGDQRINSFGIGGEMEVRSGLLYQKQIITSPIVHFGLGEHEEAEMLRIIWPNGSVQAEFAELGMGATIFNEQILKGSCPWLFTNDGEQIQFITDALWRSPLGLRINAQQTAGVIQTYDRVKIPGDQLRPVDGVYDVRITAELWETHFFDYAGLYAVDHPEGTEVFIDERFVFPAPDLSTQIVTDPVPVQAVIDQNGSDLTQIVADKDENYIAPFEKTAYQGLTEEHTIEIMLNDDGDHSLDNMLVMSGWLRPTDSSINLALSQGTTEAPKGMMVEVSSGDGDWSVLHNNYGFPAGKLKTILINLDDAFSSSQNRRVRLTTTSEIYWDSIQQAKKLSSDLIVERSLKPVSQELRFRGFSEWYRENAVSPMLPDYSQISSTAQRWRDLEGYHTRFGDVSELLSEIDDRYVIMNAGDEMIYKFEEANPLAENHKRSFVFVSDGWVKDGDYNTEASATVLPLPYHGQADYEYKASGTLFDDPVYQQHAEDWVNYHTRYITPRVFRTALRFE
jgi:Tfp pilus assembly protein PilF